jgi:hypothetical protein
MRGPLRARIVVDKFVVERRDDDGPADITDEPFLKTYMRLPNGDITPFRGHGPWNVGLGTTQLDQEVFQGEVGDGYTNLYLMLIEEDSEPVFPNDLLGIVRIQMRIVYPMAPWRPRVVFNFVPEQSCLDRGWVDPVETDPGSEIPPSGFGTRIIRCIGDGAIYDLYISVSNVRAPRAPRATKRR